MPPDPGGRSRFLLGILVAAIIAAIIAAVVLMLALHSATRPAMPQQQRGGQSSVVHRPAADRS